MAISSRFRGFSQRSELARPTGCRRQLRTCGQRIGIAAWRDAAIGYWSIVVADNTGELGLPLPSGPPDKQKAAVVLVIEQVEVFAAEQAA